MKYREQATKEHCIKCEYTTCDDRNIKICEVGYIEYLEQQIEAKDKVIEEVRKCPECNSDDIIITEYRCVECNNYFE